MFKCKKQCARIFLWALFSAASASAQHQTVPESNPNRKATPSGLVLPYLFSTETLGFGVGVVATYSPASHPYSFYFGTAYATENDSVYGLLGGWDIQLLDNLFIRPYLSAGHFTQMRIYVDGNPNYPDEQAGSNESSKDNYIEEDAIEIIADLPFRYVLPIGHHTESALHTYITHQGLLRENASGAESWNPVKSGQTVAALTPRYRRIFTDIGGDDETYETLYFKLGLEHDNRDFRPNPSRGSHKHLSISYDPALLKYSQKWSAAEGDWNQYIALPNASWSRQQTLAFSAWTAYSLQDNDAPYFTGPTLGGFYRLRAYPSHRFHDKAALYYSAEYRLMPEWQPLGSISSLDMLTIGWWQLVTLIEVGRVAPSWNLKTLHDDMKYDYGIGLRVMINNGVGRLDILNSEEGLAFVAMFGHSF